MGACADTTAISALLTQLCLVAVHFLLEHPAKFYCRRDMKGKDNRRFRIVYEDGDSEWITLQE
jgi:hypothetical protein